MLLLFPLLLLLLSPAIDDPIDVGDRKQLFIDDRFLADRDRIDLHAHPAQKLGPLIDEVGKPLQGHISRVVEAAGKIRLYLGADDVQLLESDDGLHFRRTGVELPDGGFPTLFLDDHEPDPSKRYKLFRLRLSQPFDPESDGVLAAYSADGVRFTEAGRVLPFFTDNPPLAFWDARIGKYVVYTRALAYDDPDNQRRIARIETDDLLKPWPYTKTDHERMFFSIENAQVVFSVDEQDDPHSDLYYGSPFLYPWAQDVYLMFPAHFRHYSRDRQPFVVPRVPGQWEDFGQLEIGLAVSRDGVHWSRPTRDPYVPPGLADEWDRWYSVMGPGIARRGNYLYQYYYSSGRLHDSALLRPEYEAAPSPPGGVGVVRQRLDGFVSADADHRGGSFRTPPLVFRGSALRLNIDTGALGTAFVEIQDADGHPLPGFALADCEEVSGNFLDQRLRWRGSPDVSPLSGRPLRLRFVLKRAQLFAFQFTGP